MLRLHFLNTNKHCAKHLHYPYANHSFGEYIAESFCAYHKGELKLLDS